MAISNVGVLAHVDAGKTTLTEGLLHAAGIIDEIGRVDDGTTQTDSLTLERQRGITIKAAVTSFDVDGVTINLIDTPGHPDFIAEVERVLGVLDGAILVVSAVEGVQSQTVVLFRALRRLGVPTIVFVNKLDRRGADDRGVIAAIADRLGVGVLAMGTTDGVGTHRASVTVRRLDDPAFAHAATEVLADHDDRIMRRYVDGAPLTRDHLHRALVEQTARSRVVPVYFGAALLEIGVDDILHAIPHLLPPPIVDRTAPASGTVFKVARGPARERIAFVRMFAGTMRTRDRVPLGDVVETVTGLEVFERGTTSRRGVTVGGEIAKVHGFTSARVGTSFGPSVRRVGSQAFARPTLETAIVPRDASQARAVFEALTELAEQDPLIDLRQDDARHELFLSLYGEVQKEIVAQTLADDHGLAIRFRPTTPVCVERPNRRSTAIEVLPRHRTPSHPFLATVGLEVSPLPTGSGVTFDLDVGVTSIPIHVFDDVESFRQLMERTVVDTLRMGLHGWEVTDCRVVMTACGYQAPPRRWPGTTSSDYRLLTPLVLMAALARAGTTVCEPVLAFRLELPADVIGPLMALLDDLDARPDAPHSDGVTCVLTGELRAASLHRLQTRLPDLTRGEGVMESSFAGYRPVQGSPPSRPRTDRNPLDRDDYLRRVAGRP